MVGIQRLVVIWKGNSYLCLFDVVSDLTFCLLVLFLDEHNMVESESTYATKALSSGSYDQVSFSALAWLRADR